ncbi:UbiX family flavin prenyltransferase [Devosia sp. Leaf64]|uniref:UbiX family flavin prenyltransferase n=1 Tax=Devosia sp. Leaf64 TaxID=1736229 RepID=UPI000712BA42|nr:UbiX family flavin prenyltransferase [Devosia sp. Leaf64]KQN72366.1 3-octaprenyl-4-hydroxybenzoate carboxy-lyase [Devosia sp. Leaf64]
MQKRRMIVAITGASGACYGVQALKMLREIEGIETHLIMSSAGVRTAMEEGVVGSAEEIRALADVTYPHKDIGAAVASGSFKCEGMLVAPCSIKTLSAVAHCYSDDLISRAADVCLKERRKLVLMVRETPLHAGHIALMDTATRSGAIIMPPVPSFYTRPKTLDDLVSQTVGRALDLFDLDHPSVRRWKEGGLS